MDGADRTTIRSTLLGLDNTQCSLRLSELQPYDTLVPPAAQNMEWVPKASHACLDHSSRINYLRRVRLMPLPMEKDYLLVYSSISLQTLARKLVKELCLRSLL